MAKCELDLDDLEKIIAGDQPVPSAVSSATVVSLRPIAAESIDPNVAGEHAASAVFECLRAAEHIREMGAEFLSIAQTVKATGDTLAADIEGRARLFEAMMAHARSYATETQGTFAKERDRLNNLNLPTHQISQSDAR